MATDISITVTIPIPTYDIASDNDATLSRVVIAERGYGKTGRGVRSLYNALRKQVQIAAVCSPLADQHYPFIPPKLRYSDVLELRQEFGKGGINSKHAKVLLVVDDVLTWHSLLHEVGDNVGVLAARPHAISVDKTFDRLYFGYTDSRSEMDAMYFLYARSADGKEPIGKEIFLQCMRAIKDARNFLVIRTDKTGMSAVAYWNPPFVPVEEVRPVSKVASLLGKNFGLADSLSVLNGQATLTLH